MDNIVSVISDYDDEMNFVRIQASASVPLSCCLVKEMYVITDSSLKDKAFVALHIENPDQLIILA